MFFFRAVICQLIQNKIYLYIAHQRKAENQLKKFLPVQQYFSPWKQKYNLYITELLLLITVEVTEPLRFFFCRFLLESATGLLLVLSVVLRLSIWIFTFLEIQIDWRKKEWHITTGVRTGNGVSGKKPRKKYCGNMELMKLRLSKFALMTEQTLIPTGGFTIGQATSGNTLRAWRTGNGQPK